MTRAHFLQKFQKVCYVIEEKEELLTSINNFLNETVVLPPGDWDRENMIGINHILKLKQKKRERLEILERIRKEKEDEEKAMLLPAKEKEIVKREFEKKEEEFVGTFFDPLIWTRQPFGGVLNEFKQRFPLFVSDITDAFNPMCMAAIIFIFCSALSGAIAFGGLLGNFY